MKHLYLQFYWLRDEVEKGTIGAAHVCTDLMPADIMTKALSRVKVLEMVGMLGLQKQAELPHQGGVLSYDEELCLSPAGGWLFTIIVYAKVDNSLVLTLTVFFIIDCEA